MKQMLKNWNYERKQKMVGFSFIMPWLIGFGEIGRAHV